MRWAFRAASVETFRRIGGTYAVNVWSLLIPALLWPFVAWVDPLTGGGLLLWYAIGVVGVASAGLVLLVARVTLLPPVPRPSRPVVALCVFGLAGAIHGVTTIRVADLVGIPLDDEPQRVIARVILAAVWMSVIALAVDANRRHRAVMTDLEQRLVELADLEAIEREQLETVAGELRQSAVAPLIRSLETIRTELLAMPERGAAHAAAVRLSEVIAEQVRPLSHELLGDAADWDPPIEDTSPPSRRVRMRRMLDALTDRPSRHPWLAAIAYEGSVTPLLIIAGQPASLIIANAVGAPLILGAIGQFANRTLADRCRRLPSLVRLLVGVAVSLVAVAVGNLAFAGAASVFGAIEYGYAATFVTFPLLVLLINLAVGVDEARQAEEERLRETMLRLVWARARIAQRVRHERQTLGAWLHGPTQSALLAVLNRIERSDPETREQTLLEALPDLAAAIDAIRALADGRMPAPNGADETIDAIMRMWKGALEVRLHDPEGVAGRLASDSGARDAVGDVIAEALANAVRHGGAGTVEIQLRHLERPERIRVEVVDDGEFDPASEPGAGSRMLDVITLDWAVATRADGRTEFIADVPCVLARPLETSG